MYDQLCSDSMCSAYGGDIHSLMHNLKLSLANCMPLYILNEVILNETSASMASYGILENSGCLRSYVAIRS